MCLAKELVVLVRFAYGVPEATHKRNMSGHSTNNKKTRRLRISTGSCLFFITWLIAFANKVGDQLLFGEVSAVVNQVRLPFLNKKKKRFATFSKN